VTDPKLADNNVVDASSADSSAPISAHAVGIDSPGLLDRLTTSKADQPARRAWRPRAKSWDHHTQAGLEKVIAAVLAAAAVGPGDQVVDLGCGAGWLTLPIAEQGARVLAVDVSQDAILRLGAQARERAVTGLDALATPLGQLSLPAASADLIVTCYALHHLRDVDKDRLVKAAYEWLRPGGTLLVADMMFGRGGSSADRAIITFKVRALARKGIGGWWRIAKNGYRYLVRVQDRPTSISAWTAMLSSAGFTQITASSIVAEAGLVSGRRPE
jgi:2-polyprenyl-3-methyl-5-hydroxy-6-metoxy-1,4-benzoquinol methylase